LESEADKKITEIVGGANARAKDINAEWNAKATQIKIKATSDAYN